MTPGAAVQTMAAVLRVTTEARRMGAVAAGTAGTAGGRGRGRSARATAAAGRMMQS
jgi:hypothetical protein